ncbi:tyrosine-type recombinase/integrase, partial [Klebsiella pneumoniae]|uniref:tyrosine-type recombinase/integrase n=1 Tax=Klebsiella pneumoniae TaxID=573 RepID=UPI003EDEAD76
CVEQDDKGWDARKRAYCLKIQPATGSFARNLIYSTKPRKGNPLSRQQFYQIIASSGGLAGLPLEIHPHMLRHSCGFALANMGIDTRLIQDYLGHRNIRHTVWYTASNAGRFYGIWDNPRDKQRSSLIQ